MKLPISTLLEADLIRRAKQRAADEGRQLSDVIQNALERYLSQSIAEPSRRDAAYWLEPAILDGIAGGSLCGGVALLRYGGTDILYECVQSPKRKTPGIEVHPDLRVVVRVPSGCAPEEVATRMR